MKIQVKYKESIENIKEFSVDVNSCCMKVKGFKNNTGTAYFAQFQSEKNTLVFEIERYMNEISVTRQSFIKGWGSPTLIKKFLEQHHDKDITFISRQDFLNSYIKIVGIEHMEWGLKQYEQR